jgi:hypothetical protein
LGKEVIKQFVTGVKEPLFWQISRELLGESFLHCDNMEVRI